MFAAIVFFLVAAFGWGVVLLIGLPAAIVITPWIILAGGFVLPGLTAARLPLSAAWLLAILLFANRERLEQLIRHPDRVAVWFVGFLVVLALLVPRSPDPGQGIRMVVQGGVALSTVIVFRIGLDFVPRQVLLRSAVLSALALALPIIWFRIDPASELTFLQSSIAGFFIEPVSLSELLRGYWFQTNNTLDARKAGAVFINANVASVYLCLFLAAAVGTLLRRPSEAWAQAAVPVLIAGILATGSRIGAVTAVGIAFVGLFMGRGKLGRWLPVAFAVTLLIAVPILIPTLLRFQPAVLLSDERILLWPLAVRRILDGPLLGSGFGDWEAWLGGRMAILGIHRVLPPHNLVLHLALWGGLLALAAFGGFLYKLFERLWRRWRADDGDRGYALGIALLATAVMAHAMFDNFFLFDWHMGPASASLVALMWGTEPAAISDDAPGATPLGAAGIAR